MTSTTFVSPPLQRPRDALVAGVCAALARTTGTSPVLWRVLVVVLAFFGGLGIVLYLVGVVAIRAEGQQQPIAERLLRGPDRRLTGRQLLAVVLLVLALAALLSQTDGLVAVAVIAGLGLLWLRGRPAPWAAPVAEAPGPAAPPAPDAPPPTWYVPPPPHRRSPLTGITLSLAAVVVGGLLLVAAAGRSVPADVVLAGALAVVGLGLVAGATRGRATGLVTVAVLLAVALAATLAVRPVAEHGIGERTWRPGDSAAFRLGVGEATLDLRSLAGAGNGPVTLSARVDVGHLLVLVPDDLRIHLDARAALGDVLVLGESADGQNVTRRAALGPPGDPQVLLDLRVGTGQVEVRRG